MVVAQEGRETYFHSLKRSGSLLDLHPMVGRADCLPGQCEGVRLGQLGEMGTWLTSNELFVSRTFADLISSFDIASRRNATSRRLHR